MTPPGPLVSIITLTYNHERFIGECLRSVLAQTYEDWELLVMDDGSPDRTGEIVRSFQDPRIRYVRQPHIGISGIAGTYNRALDLSRGALVAILEGDDFWPPAKLAALTPLFEDPEVVLAYGIAQHVGADGTLIRGTIPSAKALRTLPRACLQNDPVGSAVRPMLGPDVGVFTYPCATVVRSASLRRVGGFLTVGDGHAVDWATFITLALHGRFAFLPEVMGYWRRHGNAISAPERIEQVLREDYQYLRTFAASHQDALGLSAEDRWRIDSAWDHLWWRLKCTQGRMLLLRGRWKEARGRFFSALAHHRGALHRGVAALGIAASVAHTDLEFMWTLRGEPSLRVLGFEEAGRQDVRP